MSKSFSLLRTNTGLTTNIKIMVDTNYKLSLDSIESDMNLSFDKFKNVSFNKSNYYDELIPYFYKDLPVDTAFSIKYDNDVDTMNNDFSNQYDELYQYGARNIIDNKNYSEEYEYFAPLYISKTGLPKKFIIFRVDGPGIGTLSKVNFKTEILKRFKTVKMFDLTKESFLGEWLYTNFVDNKYFPDSPLEMDFRNLEFCKWNGIDYQNGGYTSKSLFIDDILDEEKEIFELEKFVFDSYKNNKVVFPNILNLSFLFDDTPSTPEEKRKWSINRYYGFYLDDLEKVSSLSPYLTPQLKSDVVIENNLIYSVSEDYPFQEVWSDKKPFYVEYNGNYYKVEQYTETITNELIKFKNNKGNTSEDRMQRDLGFSSSKKTASSIKVVNTKVYNTNTESSVESYGDVIVTKYRIISDLDLTGKESKLNKSFVSIDINNVLIDVNNDPFVIYGYDNADVWLIEVDGVLHNIIKDDNKFKIYSDYSFIFEENSFSYKVTGIKKTVNNVVDFSNSPVKFNIYRLKFTDIKDFDNRIVDTEFSKYEYEKVNELTKTDETKMYFEDLLSKSDPRDLDDFVYKNDIVNIPVSSEYTANYETFKVDGGELSEIWRKNSVYCRFGFQNSLSSNDVPYLLNNSLIFEDYNRTANPSDIDPKRIERNLDYFYTINSSTSSYSHHTLHIEKLDSNKNIDTTFKFELDKYLNIATYSYIDEFTSLTQSATYSFDYFSYFFSKDTEFITGKVKKNTKKYSYFNIGDDSISNHTLFRGIKFDIFKVSGVNLNSNNQIDKINIDTNNDFIDYKLSILLSDNDMSVTNSGSLTSSTNTLSWKIIDEWKMDKQYPKDSVVIFDDILYTNAIDKSPCGPTKNGYISNPYNQGWELYNIGPLSTPSYVNTTTYSTIFWSPNVEDAYLKYVYNSEEYYLNVGSGSNFWSPVGLSYSITDSVLFKNNYYISITDNNFSHPKEPNWVNISNVNKWSSSETYYKSSVVSLDGVYYISTTDNNKGSLPPNTNYWIPCNITEKWKPIEVWNPSVKYNSGDFKIHNNILYVAKSPAIGEPGVSDSWDRKYSITPDTNINYSKNNNPIILMNDKYYLSDNDSQSSSTLDNGIIIYINKKWKNILVNINISDNTYKEVSNVDRDSIYNELYKKVTAANVMSAINDLTNKYGFVDYVSYVVIDENNNIKKYSFDNDIKNIPYLLRCEGPDSLDVKIQSLLKRPVSTPNSLKPIKKLENGKILNIDELNYYNNNPIAVNIIENKFEPKIFENYHGSKNIISNTIFRFSGYYMPLFYDIDLFKRDYEYKSSGNYLFDTDLYGFGIMKERKIRKINRSGSILRLKDSVDEKSIYPMLDEFGYSIYDFFIFSSTWDLKYYLETNYLYPTIRKEYLQRYTIDENIINNNEVKETITIPTNIGPIQN